MMQPRKPHKKRRPSMSDVARLAGVSRTTVSFVLNDVPYANIPDETRERIKQAVEQLSYRPNAIARGLRSNRSYTIGFISDEILTTPHAGRMIQGAQDAAWEHQKLLLLVNTGLNKELEAMAIDMMLERQVDGIVYATMYHHLVTVPEQIREVPVVLLDCYCADHSLPSVVPDEVAAGRTAVTALLQAGHRRIGFMNNVDDIPATRGRLEGYKQALAEHHVSFDESLVCAVESSSNGGRIGAHALLSLPQPPTAIFCFSDFMAMGAYQVIQERGLVVPNDVAIIGFDNHELIAPALTPALTSMALPHYEMGRWAIDHLLQLIEHPEQIEDNAPVQKMLTCPLVERHSMGGC